MIRLLLSTLVLATAVSSLSAGHIKLEKRDRDRLKKETVYAIDLIQRYHYKQTSFADIDSEELLRQYIKDLDGSHVFFLQSDIDFLISRFTGSLKPSYLYLGDLYPAFEIYNVYHDRITERLEWVQGRLKEPFDFETDRTYLSDREEAEWPADLAAAEELWDKRLTNELILELLEDEPLDRALEKVSKRYERMAKFLSEVEIHNVQETFLTSLARLYDPHSNFFSWDSAQEFDIQISNALVGIGAQLRDIDGYCVIERLLPGGPAEMSGKLHPGDKIVEVAQGDSKPVDVVGMKLRKIVQQIRGETGTEVRLTVIPAHSAKRQVITLKREKVELTANLASADLYEIPVNEEHNRRIGVIDLPSFYGEGAFGEGGTSTSDDVEELINKLKEEQVEGLVLDLRSNGGGRLDEAIKLTGLFISKGPVVMKRSFDGEVEEDWDRNSKVAWDGPLVVLVSRSSASASEIVAGALQSLGRAVVVGDEATHGKGTVQAPIDLRSTMRSLPYSNSLEVGTVKITVQQFYLPNGDSTQNRGVLSDISLPSANMFLFDGEADLDNALNWDHIAPIVYTLPERSNPDFALVQDNLMSQLSAKSSGRQDSSEEFDYLKESIAWFKERHDMKTVSLNIEERRKDKEQVETVRDHFDDLRDTMSKELAYDVKAVELDMTKAKDDTHQAKLASTPLPDGSSRVNKFYQKVFYYQDPESDDQKIHEIWVEYFDYEEALDEAESIAGILTESSGIEISTDQATDILTRLKNADRGSDFNILNPFAAVLGEEIDKEALLAAMPEFFTKMVEVDPDILLERSKLDIPLRESLRIVRDWIDIDSPLADTEIAAKLEEVSEET
ncbi:MAG: carboxy terminal-processing peptidase [Puniceicoccaceae bacterium]